MKSAAVDVLMTVVLVAVFVDMYMMHYTVADHDGVYSVCYSEI